MFQHHLSVEDVFLINVDVDQLATILGVLRDKILYRVDTVIDEMLLTLDVTGKSTHPVMPTALF